jgi:hypothetical protein
MNEVQINVRQMAICLRKMPSVVGLSLSCSRLSPGYEQSNA